MTERKRTIKSMIPMRDGVSEENRMAIIKLLNQQLADHYVLVTKTKFYHWNIEGPEFHDLHELLDEHYEIIAEMVDTIAEQALKIGGQAAGTLEWFKAHTRLGEDAGENIPDSRAMIHNLLNDHETVMTNLYADINKIDEDYKDAVTSNMLQDISDKHHKMAWMLRMTLQPSTLEDVQPLDVRGKRITEV
jgi:starvation-inducible DNA-binding protein